jgi:O-antigen ligase
MVISRMRCAINDWGPVLLWLAGFFLSLKLFPGTGEFDQIGAVLCGFAGLAWALGRDGTPLAARFVTAPVLWGACALLLLWSGLSGLWSVAPAVTWMHMGGWSLFIVTMLALLIMTPPDRDRFLAQAGSGVACIIAGICVWALVQMIFMPEMLVAGQVRHPFTNPNVLAVILNAMLFAGVGFYWAAQDKNQRRILWVLLFLYLAAFIGIASKGGMIVMAVGVVLMMALPRRGWYRACWKGLVLLALAGGAVAIAFSFLPGRASLFGQVAIFLQTDFATAINRMDIWMATLEMVRQNPIFGFGYRSFALVYPSVRLPADIYSSGSMAHSDPLQLAAELGVVGVALFYAVAVLVLIRFVRVFPRGRDPVMAALFVAAAGFVGHSHIDFPFYTLPAMLVFALIFIALVGRLYDPQAVFVKDGLFGRFPPRGQVGLVAIPVLVWLMFFTALMTGEYHSNRARAFLAQQNIEAYADAVNKANAVSFGLHGQPYIMAAAVPLSILKEEGAIMPLAEQQKLLLQIWSLLDRAERVHQRLAAVPFHRAETLLNAAPDIHPPHAKMPEVYLQRALDIDPAHLAARMMLADRLMAAGRGDAAYDLLLAGIPWAYPTFDAKAYYARVRRMAQDRGDNAALDRINAAEALHDGRVADATRHYFLKMQRRFRAAPEFEDSDLRRLRPF